MNLKNRSRIKNDPWFSDRLEKMDLNLSESEPIRAWSANYTEKTSSSFDMHYPLEVGIVLSGQAVRYYHNYKTTLNPGQIWLCGIWEPHGYEILKVPCRKLLMVILPQFLTKLQIIDSPQFSWLAPFMAEPQKRPQIPQSLRPAILDLGRQITDTLAAKTPSDSVRLRLLALNLLLTIQENWDAPPADYYDRKDNFSLINKALQMIFTSKQGLTTQDAAKSCGINRHTFNRIFEQKMGISFAQFELRHRVSSAAADLKNTNNPIKTIAFKWGFTDSSHLYRCFDKYYHCTPSQYLQRNRQ